MKERMPESVLGLDLGIASIGWCLLNHKESKIEGMGVRTFKPPHDEKTEESTAKARGDARRIRRTLDRRKKRMKKIRLLLAKHSLASKDFLRSHYLHNHLEPLQDPQKRKEIRDGKPSYHYDDKDGNPWKLRVRALTEKISAEQISSCLLHLAKHRGFKSMRKTEEAQLLPDSEVEDGKKNVKDEKAKEQGKINAAIKRVNEFRETYKEKHGKYPTPAEVVEKDDSYRYLPNIRNRSGQYIGIFLRKDIEDEARQILQKQKSLGHRTLNEEFIGEYITLLTDQKPMQDTIDLVGWCQHEPAYKRAPRHSYALELYNVCFMLNNIKVNDNFLSAEKKEIALDELRKSKSLKFAGLKTKLGYAKTDRINYKGKEKLNDFAGYHKIREAVLNATAGELLWEKINPMETDRARTPDELETPQAKIIDRIAEALTYCKSDENIEKYLEGKNKTWEKAHSNKSELTFIELATKLGLDKNATDTIIQSILKVDITDVGKISIHTARKLTKILIATGCTYDAAVTEEYGEDAFKQSLNGSKHYLPELTKHQLTEITSPVVRRAIYRTREVINAIIRRYGMSSEIKIELARELVHSKKKRSEIEKGQTEFKAQKDKAVEDFAEKFDRKPVRDELTRYRLFKDQGAKCLYSGERIELEDVINHNTQIDHILPYSRSYDDTLNNQVLCFTSENQNKSDKTPAEWMGTSSEKWKKFKGLVIATKSIKKAKGNNLLMEDFKTEEGKFIQRNLTDTQYLSRFIMNYLREHLDFGEERQHKVNIMAVNGRITARLRQIWGLRSQKNPETAKDKKHSLIVSDTGSQENLETTKDKKYSKRSEGDTHHAVDAAIIASVTPSMLHRISTYYKKKEDLRLTQAYDQKKEDQKDKHALEQHAPKPWETFRADTLAAKKAITVSRWARIKDAGAANKETIYGTSPGSADERDHVVRYKSISAIKKNSDLQKTVLAKRSREAFNHPDTHKDLQQIKDLHHLLERRLEDKGEKSFSQGFAWRNNASGAIIDVTDDFIDRSKEEQYAFLHHPDHPVRVIRKLKMEESLKAARPLKERGYAANGAMLRIDVFGQTNKKGKYQYYAVPLYAHNVVEKTLFSKACVIKKDEADWVEMDETYEFLFSLYADEMIELERSGVFYRGYYKFFDRSSASISMAGHDKYFIHASTFKEDFKETPPSDINFSRIRTKEEVRELAGKIGEGKSEDLLDKAGKMTRIGFQSSQLFRKVKISPLGASVKTVPWQERKPLCQGQHIPAHA